MCCRQWISRASKMSSSAVKNNNVRYVLALVTLVLGAAGEELMPKILCVGFPFLIGATVFFASRASRTLFVLFALAAGAAEDSLSGLPFLTSASFFLFVAALIRLTQLPYLVAGLAFPVYQLWLCIWSPELIGSVFARVLMSIPIGAVTSVGMMWLLASIERREAVDEEG